MNLRVYVVLTRDSQGQEQRQIFDALIKCNVLVIKWKK